MQNAEILAKIPFKNCPRKGKKINLKLPHLIKIWKKRGLNNYSLKRENPVVQRQESQTGNGQEARGKEKKVNQDESTIIGWLRHPYIYVVWI